MIHVALERFTVVRNDLLVVDIAELSVVAAAHGPISKLEVQSRGDLHIRAHLENRFRGVARGSHPERMDEARLVLAGIDASFRRNPPGDFSSGNVLDEASRL